MGAWLIEIIEAMGAWAIAIPIGIGILLGQAVVSLVPPQHVPAVTRGLKVVGTAAAGAAIGTAIAPGIGTVIGAGIGAVIGFFW